jgi:hypothetical protein
MAGEHRCVGFVVPENCQQVRPDNYAATVEDSYAVGQTDSSVASGIDHRVAAPIDNSAVAGHTPVRVALGSCAAGQTDSCAADVNRSEVHWIFVPADAADAVAPGGEDGWVPAAKEAAQIGCDDSARSTALPPTPAW